MAASTKDPVVSKSFNAPDYDMTIISSDGTHFRVHSQALLSSSQVFKDMFEVGRPSEGKAEVNLTESADTLEAVLVYIYPRSLTAFRLSSPDCLVVIRALHKYELSLTSMLSSHVPVPKIWRGLDAVKSAFHLDYAKEKNHLRQSALSVADTKLETALHGYTFAALTLDKELGVQSLQLMAGLQFPWTNLVALSKRETCSTDSEAATKLVNSWGLKRLAALEAYTQVGIPRSCAEVYNRHSCRIKVKDEWQSLHHITDPNLVPLSLQNLGCRFCRVAFNSNATAYRQKLQSLPKLGFWNDRS